MAKEKTARKACLSGDYTKGVDLLAELFVDTKDPTYLFNQGRCFEQNRRYEDALARFQEYLVAVGSKVSPEQRETTEQRIKSCKEMLAQERGSAIVPAAPQAVVPAPTPPEPAVAVTQSAPRPAGTAGAGLRVGGIIVASLGVVAVGTAVLLNVRANSIVDDMYATNNGYTKESDRKSYETGAWVGYGVGAACVVAGAILYAFGVRARSHEANDLALVPIVSTDRGGAALMGVF